MSLPTCMLPVTKRCHCACKHCVLTDATLEQHLCRLSICRVSMTDGCCACTYVVG